MARRQGVDWASGVLLLLWHHRLGGAALRDRGVRQTILEFIKVLGLSLLGRV